MLHLVLTSTAHVRQVGLYHRFYVVRPHHDNVKRNVLMPQNYEHLGEWIIIDFFQQDYQDTPGIR